MEQSTKICNFNLERRNEYTKSLFSMHFIESRATSWHQDCPRLEAFWLGYYQQENNANGGDGDKVTRGAGGQDDVTA